MAVSTVLPNRVVTTTVLFRLPDAVRLMELAEDVTQDPQAWPGSYPEQDTLPGVNRRTLGLPDPWPTSEFRARLAELVRTSLTGHALRVAFEDFRAAWWEYCEFHEGNIPASQIGDGYTGLDAETGAAAHCDTQVDLTLRDLLIGPEPAPRSPSPLRGDR